MIVKFGNLTQPRHSEDPKKPEAEEKVTEMMKKLHEEGFTKQNNISNGIKEGKFYHVFDLPHQMEFGIEQGVIEIIKPYSKYLKPLQVVVPDKSKQNQ